MHDNKRSRLRHFSLRANFAIAFDTLSHVALNPKCDSIFYLMRTHKAIHSYQVICEVNSLCLEVFVWGKFKKSYWAWSNQGGARACGMRSHRAIYLIWAPGWLVVIVIASRSFVVIEAAVESLKRRLKVMCLAGKTLKMSNAMRTLSAGRLYESLDWKLLPRSFLRSPREKPDELLLFL